MELGEAEWYFDIKPDGLFHVSSPNNTTGFDIAKDFYRHWCQPTITAVDAHGPTALKLDLNKPLGLKQTFDLVINHGTMEHVFNVAQFLVTMHECCKDGGLMIHDSPWTGWLDHGFFSFHPTLYYDLAAKNGYEIELCAMHEIRSRRITRIECRDHIAQLAAAGKVPANAMLFVAMRKRGTKPFRIPMQGYYDGSLSAAGQMAWRTMR